MTTDIMALQGVPDTIYLPMRYGGHISAAIWIATSAWRTTGATRLVGLLLALDLGGFSFVPQAAFVGLIPSGVLLPLWIALVGLTLRRTAGADAANHETRPTPSQAEEPVRSTLPPLSHGDQ
jgi:hypothetical protein